VKYPVQAVRETKGGKMNKRYLVGARSRSGEIVTREFSDEYEAGLHAGRIKSNGTTVHVAWGVIPIKMTSEAAAKAMREQLREIA